MTTRLEIHRPRAYGYLAGMREVIYTCRRPGNAQRCCTSVAGSMDLAPIPHVSLATRRSVFHFNRLSHRPLASESRPESVGSGPILVLLCAFLAGASAEDGVHAGCGFPTTSPPSCRDIANCRNSTNYAWVCPWYLEKEGVEADKTGMSLSCGRGYVPAAVVVIDGVINLDICPHFFFFQQHRCLKGWQSTLLDRLFGSVPLLTFDPLTPYLQPLRLERAMRSAIEKEL
jgi:hypothetical protein